MIFSSKLLGPSFQQTYGLLCSVLCRIKDLELPGSESDPDSKRIKSGFREGRGWIRIQSETRLKVSLKSNFAFSTYLQWYSSSNRIRVRSGCSFFFEVRFGSAFSQVWNGKSGSTSPGSATLILGDIGAELVNTARYPSSLS